MFEKPKYVIPKCSVTECTTLARVRGLCNKHYSRMQRCGTLEITKITGDGETWADRFWSRVNKKKPDECWHWKGAPTKYGYGVVSKDSRIMKAHRAAWELANRQAVPDGLSVLHSCDNRICVNPHHLRVGTNSDNVNDREQRNRGAKGNKLVKNALNADAVREIKEYLRNGWSPRLIRSKVSATASQIRNIQIGRTFKWVES